MIYSLILNIRELEVFLNSGDCQNWQPLALIPDDVSELIYKTKNSDRRSERIAAYSLLCYTVKHFFGYDVSEIERNSYGKPYFKATEAAKKLYFNISHSKDFCAILISDEGEVGIDIQAMPNTETAERLSKRYLNEVDFNLISGNYLNGDHRNIEYYLTSPDTMGFSLQRVNVDNITHRAEDIKFLNSDKSEKSLTFSEKWALCEAALKCYGTGFSDLGKINEYFPALFCRVFSFCSSGTSYSLAVSIIKKSSKI